MKRLSIALVAGLATIAVCALPAQAGKNHYQTKVTINFTPGTYGDTFFGEVKSNQKAACKKNRTVKIKREEGDSDPVYGQDTSDNQGDYSVSNGIAPDGDYYAKVKKRVLNNGKTCLAAKSGLIEVD